MLDNELEIPITGLVSTGGREEEYLYMSLESLGVLTKKPMTLDVVEVSVAGGGAELQQTVERINSAAPQAKAKLVKRVTASEATVLSKLQALVLLVTVIVLALTMITVGTTTTAVVTERRKEIALRKALGASNQSIIREFMGEQLFLGATGGVLGAICGFGFAQLISTQVFSSSISFRPVLLPAAVLVSLIITALACLMPIRSATEIEPALVLKGE